MKDDKLNMMLSMELECTNKIFATNERGKKMNTPTFENWINDDNPLFDVDCETLIINLVNKGHSLEDAIKLVESLNVEVII